MTNPAPGIIRPQVPPRASANLAESMVQEINPSSVLRRWGIITGIRVNGTVDVDVAGVEVLAVKRYATYNPVVGERVQIDVVNTDLVVVGATAPSPRNQTTNIRVATVTAIQTNGTLNVTFDDGQIATGLQRMAHYQPTVNDVVQVLQSGSTTKFIVLGVLYGNSQPYLRRPVGDVEFTIRKTAKPGTLLLDGSTVLRADYPALFAWVQSQGYLQTPTVPNLFGMGNQSTNFVLPDMRGRTILGADATNLVGALFGAKTHTIAAANQPQHTHTVADHAPHNHVPTLTIYNHGNHGHSLTGGSIGGDGDHGGHFNASQVLAAGGSTYGVAPWNSAGSNRGYHGHPPTAVFADANSAGPHDWVVGVNNANVSAHVVGQAGSATPTPIDHTSPSIAVNWLIYV